MTRRTRTAWLVVDPDGSCWGAWPSKKYVTGVTITDATGRLCTIVRVVYPWPPAKKRRKK